VLTGVVTGAAQDTTGASWEAAVSLIYHGLLSFKRKIENDEPMVLILAQ
jgi:hypothetical protein